MTIAYSGYGIPTPDSTDLNRTAHRIRYKHNMANTSSLNKTFVSVKAKCRGLVVKAEEA